MNDRAAWTQFVDGKRPHKYGAQRQGKYASKHEAEVAQKLWILADCEKIQDLREQVRFELVPGKHGVRGIYYVADFTFVDEDKHLHVCDAKGFKTYPYKLKARMMYLLLGITIEEL